MEGFHHHTPASENPPKATQEKISISDIDDAREYVSDLLGEGVRPIITVPVEYAESVIQDGISFVPKEDGLTGKRFSFIAGTIGVPPLSPSTEERYVLSINSDVKIEPRMTGKDNAFHGVVQFPDGVPPEAFTIIGRVVHGSFVADNDDELPEDIKKTSLH